MLKKLLLVDDDIDDRELFCEAVHIVDPSIYCDTVADAPSALSLLTQNNKPDIIFLDINLPVISGWECLSLLKKNDHLRDIPVIIYSTSSYEKDKQIAKELGADQFMTKPHDFNMLINLLGNVIKNN